MLEELERIYKRKRELTAKMIESNNQLMATVYKGLAKNKPIREIHRDIRNVYQKLPVQDTKALKYSLVLAKKGVKNNENNKKLVKNVGKEVSLLDFSLLAWRFMNEQQSFEMSMKITYNHTRTVESEEKEEMIKEELKQHNIMYLSSYHTDSASDHAPFQAKYFINANWKQYVKNQELRNQIQAFVNQNKIKTFQWVTGSPVYLITRPNCRHYFKRVTVEEALMNSPSYLVAKYNMQRQVGDRKIQTYRTPKKEDRIASIKEVIRKYENRLSFHQLLYKQAPNEQLKNYIQKDRFLINKWKTILKQMS